jgi:transposase-like protein
MSQITLISGPERRRVWSDEQKRELVAAVSAPGANVAEIARRADLRSNQIYWWRRQMDGVIAISPSQMACMLEAIDWRNPQAAWRPTLAG